jgi:hypothetical protein
MNSQPEIPEVEILIRFLSRFADLMSIGSNAENLLRAAQLLEINSTRAREAERLLREECNKSATHLAFSRLLEANCSIFENEIASLKSEIAQLHATFNEAITDAAGENADLLRRAEQAEARLALVGDDHVTVPLSLLRLAAAQFNALAREFRKSGHIVSQVMCEASASTLNRIVETDLPPAVAHKGTAA